MTPSEFQQTIFDSLQPAIGRSLHLTLDDEPATGRVVSVGGQSLLSFGSCSYLGLETDPRLVEGAVTAARRFALQTAICVVLLAATLPACAILIPAFGLIGAAWAAVVTTAVNTLMNVGLLLYVYKLESS
ncbi:MAG: hypothetical protein AAGC55_12270 [Myxococcota bacterium]